MTPVLIMVGDDPSNATYWARKYVGIARIAVRDDSQTPPVYYDNQPPTDPAALASWSPIPASVDPTKTLACRYEIDTLDPATGQPQ